MSLIDVTFRRMAVTPQRDHHMVSATQIEDMEPLELPPLDEDEADEAPELSSDASETHVTSTFFRQKYRCMGVSQVSLADPPVISNH